MDANEYSRLLAEYHAAITVQPKWDHERAAELAPQLARLVRTPQDESEARALQSAWYENQLR